MIAEKTNLKLLEFVKSTLGDPKAFRDQTVKSLSKIFGYQRCGFWLVNEKGYLYSPVTSSNYMDIQEYQNGYYYYDFSCPFNVGKKALKDEVVLLNQLIKKEDLGKSKYFGFMQKMDYFHEISMFLKQNDTIIGVISIIRGQNEDDFEERDVVNLKSLADYLASRLSEIMNLEYNEKMKNMFMTFAELSDTGLIIFGKNFLVNYYNNAALKICEHMGGDENKKENPVEFFIKSILANNSIAWVSGMKKNIMLPDFQQISIAVNPIKSSMNFSEQQLYMVQLKTIDDSPNNGLLLANTDPAQYNLSFRELEIIRLVMSGYANQKIANELFISINTVKKHLSQIYNKLSVSNRTSLIYKINTLKNNLDFTCFDQYQQ